MLPLRSVSGIWTQTIQVYSSRKRKRWVNIQSLPDLIKVLIQDKLPLWPQSTSISDEFHLSPCTVQHMQYNHTVSPSTSIRLVHLTHSQWCASKAPSQHFYIYRYSYTAPTSKDFALQKLGHLMLLLILAVYVYLWDAKWDNHQPWRAMSCMTYFGAQNAQCLDMSWHDI